MNSIFTLRALAAQIMPQVQSHLHCHAAEKPAIHAKRSKTNPANSQTADKAWVIGLTMMTAFGIVITDRLQF
ncbi:hypothetical protein [Phaeobacter inhibens]|uniref:Uncharacterized protein n=1 Tax=Phaeobacter inhibens TaxID=221822 RepID=A0A2I7KG29_9RHOB|nr:hypothetical protein [Phaeobacter inhibens]AUR01521.1 hypothetical protein PhaeoP88_04209 [Phaeobacter inhibens]